MAAETVRVEGLSETLAALDAIRKEIAQSGVQVKAANPVRAALRQAANVIMKQARANVDAIVATPNVGGRDLSTGLLKKSIKVYRPKKRYMRGHTDMAQVRVDSKARYPVGRAGKKYPRVSDVAFMLEIGTERRAPMPFMRPAFENKKGEALEKFRTEFTTRVQQLIDRYRNVGQ